MSFQFNEILKIPERILVNKKIPKSFFLKNFELSAIEKKIILAEILSVEWLASIKPINSNVVAFFNETQIYEEIQIISCNLTGNQIDSNASKAIQLIQKHIPYPVILFVENDLDFVINACIKRVNLNDKNKRTIENLITTDAISKLYKNEIQEALFKSLEFSQLEKQNLEILYKGYVSAIIQYKTSLLIKLPTKRTNERTNEDLQAMLQIENISKEIQRLTNILKKVNQLNEKVSLNIEIQKHRNKIKEITDKLQ